MVTDDTQKLNQTDRSSLRDRIAAVLADADGMPWHEWSKAAQDGYQLRADAVIVELGLRQEWGCLDPNDDGVIADSRDQVAEDTCWGGVVKTRWITDWQPEETDET